VGGFCGFVTRQDHFRSRGKAGRKVGQVAISACYSLSVLTWFGMGKATKLTIQRHYGLAVRSCLSHRLEITL